MAITAHLGIGLLESAQAQKEVTVNEGFARIDAVLNSGVVTRGENTPPATPASGDVYIVGPSPTGAWAGKSGKIAYHDHIWRFISPNEGLLMWVNDENAHYVFNGTAWAQIVLSADMTKSIYDQANISQQVVGTTAAQTLTNKTLAGTALSVAIPGYIHGLVLANNTTDAVNDIDVAVGRTTDSTGAYNITLSSALTKRLDASWAVGSGNGGLDTGSIANTTYHVFLIQRSDTGGVDALFSASATTPTLPTNYDRFRRIGSILRIAGGIRPFVQDGDDFRWVTPAADIDSSSPGSSAVTRAVTVPSGISVLAYGQIQIINAGSATNGHLLSDLRCVDVAPSTAAAAVPQVRAVASGVAAGSWMVRTNTSAQIRSRNETANNDVVRASTHGWIDSRGK